MILESFIPLVVLASHPEMPVSSAARNRIVNYAYCLDANYRQVAAYRPSPLLNEIIERSLVRCIPDRLGAHSIVAQAIQTETGHSGSVSAEYILEEVDNFFRRSRNPNAQD